LRISGLSKFEFTVVNHWIYLGFVRAGHLWLWLKEIPAGYQAS
jgi:hypothetical protein